MIVPSLSWSSEIFFYEHRKSYITRLTFIEGDFLGAEGEACLEVEAEDTRMSCFFSPP